MANPEKAFIKTEDGQQIPCMFNPTEFSMQLSNSWSGKTIANRRAPKVRFGGSDSATMSMDLTFDSTDTGKPVTDYTDKLVKLMQLSDKAPGWKASVPAGRPLWCQFGWGRWLSFKSVITSLSLSFTYFGSDGTPLRAKATLSLKQYEPDAAYPYQNPTSGTPMPHRVHQVQVGETLDRISAQAYGDANQWRAIAEANGILNPLALEPGMIIALPDVTGTRYAR
jgi:hypothetical protein